MGIKEAIKEAKEHCNWSVVLGKPTSVNVLFMTKGYFEDETQLDLYGNNKEEELEELWGSLEEELGALENGVISVDALGFIDG